MKIFLLAACLFVAVSAFEPIGLNYHETVGIPEATRIRNAEAAVNGARIVGGIPSQLGVFPYMGGLVITLNSGSTSVCGSSMLSNNKFLTAAHCWFDGQNQGSQLVVVVGSTTLFTGGIRETTNNVFTHEGYDTNNRNNDIAIITTNFIAYTDNINSIALASGSDNFAGTWATAAGYGRTSDSAGISTNQELRHLNLQVITNEMCASTFGSTVVTDTTLCTSGAGGQSTCGGDFGGPLVSNRTLIGVSSFASASGCEQGHPSGFVRVSPYHAWITSHI